jgi:hypothetical protein
MKKRLIMATLVASLLAGCTVGLNYRRPVVKPPEVFRASDATPPTDLTSLADLKWFEVFKDERLRETGRPVSHYCGQRRYDDAAQLHQRCVSPPSGLRAETDIWQRGAPPPLVRTGYLGSTAPRYRSRTGRFTRQRGEPQGSDLRSTTVIMKEPEIIGVRRLGLASRARIITYLTDLLT